MPAIRDYHFHLPFYHVDSDRNLKLLYAIRVLGDLIGKSVFLFLPLYLFELGTQFYFFESFPFNNFQKGIIFVACYYLTARIVGVFSSIISGQVIHKFGTRTSILIAYVCELGLLIMFNLSRSQPLLIFVAAVLFGLYLTFFFNAYHYLFSKAALKKHMGEDLGIVHFFLKIAAVIAPTFGGIVIVAWGYETLFLWGLVGVVLSMFLTLKMKDRTDGVSPTIQDFFVWIKSSIFFQKAISFAGRYMHDTAIALWPLYIFLLLGSADKVGFLYSLSLFLALLITFVTGLYIDHRGKTNRPFFVSGGILTLLWLLRINITNFWNIALVDTFDKLTSSFHWLFYDARFIGSGKGKMALPYFVYRELVISLTAVVVWSTVILIFVFSQNWNTLFVIGAIGVLLSLFIREAQDEKRK